MAETGDMTDEHLIRAEWWPFGQWLGGLVIHLPSVVRTSSPSYTVTTVLAIEDNPRGAVLPARGLEPARPWTR